MTTILKIQETRGNEQIFEETDLSRNANRKVTGKWCKEYTHTHTYIYTYTHHIYLYRDIYIIWTQSSQQKQCYNQKITIHNPCPLFFILYRYIQMRV